MTTLSLSQNRSSNHQSAPKLTTDISYQLDFDRFFEHLVDVTLSFTADTASPRLWLPAWIPGSYLMREFARNITAVYYRIENQESKEHSGASSFKQRANKIDKNTWQLPQV
ncbi:M61 family metallopeptidase, partial [Psychrobacter sp. 1U2]